MSAFIVKVIICVSEPSVKLARIGWRGLTAFPSAMPNGRVFNFNGEKKDSPCYLYFISSDHPQMHSGQAICVAFFSAPRNPHLFSAVLNLGASAIVAQ